MIYRKQNNGKTQKAIPAMALISCALWGSLFPFIKIGYTQMRIDSGDVASQIVFAGITFALAGIFTIAVASIASGMPYVPSNIKLNGCVRTDKGNNLLKVYKGILVVGLFQTVFQYTFLYIGLSYTTGIRTSIITSSNVFFSVLIAGLLFRHETLTTKKIAGTLIGFVGVLIINVCESGGALASSYVGDFCVLAAALSVALAVSLVKAFAKDINPILLSGWQAIYGGLVLLVLGFSCGGRIAVHSVSNYLIIAYISIASAVAYAIWCILLKHYPVSKVTVYGLTEPVFGFVLSAVLLSEWNGINVFVITALIAVTIGIFLVNTEEG